MTRIKCWFASGRRLSTHGILGDWLRLGEVRSVIDRNYKLDEIPDALTYQGDFHARAKVVVTI